jgi:hypothetical protein
VTDHPSDAPIEVLNDLDREAGARGRSERRLAAAHELVEVGLDLARALRAEVMAQVSGVENAEGEAAGKPVFGGDVALAYSRIARAVRMSLALEAMIDGDVQVRHERVRRETWSQDSLDRINEGAEAEAEAEEMIRSEVRRAIEADGAGRGERERLFGALEEVLEDEHDWKAIEGLSLGEAVEYICRELGVPFDRELWLDEAEPDADAADVPDRADTPDGLDQALERASHCGDGAGPRGKPRPP